MTEKDEKQFIYTAVLGKIIKNLDSNNQILLETLNEPNKIYTKLLNKYTDRSPIKNEKLKLEFHTYKLKSDESIQHTYNRLKQITREIIMNDDNIRNAYNSEIIYS